MAWMPLTSVLIFSGFSLRRCSSVGSTFLRSAADTSRILRSMISCSLAARSLAIFRRIFTRVCRHKRAPQLIEMYWSYVNHGVCQSFLCTAVDTSRTLCSMKSCSLVARPLAIFRRILMRVCRSQHHNSACWVNLSVGCCCTLNCLLAVRAADFHRILAHVHRDSG